MLAVPALLPRRAAAAVRLLVMGALAGATIACGGDARPSGEGAEALPPGAAALDSASRRMVAFLRGSAPFDSSAFADSVQLLLAPEGGGARDTRTRAQLAEPRDWQLQADGARYSFVPPGSFTVMTARLGRHLNCQESDLSARAPALASHPHVGVMLAPPNATSCLQSWVVTFVFDTTGRARPQLIGALYDQWEW